MHGYKVEFGFFNGICLGAAQLPYEQSCELIQQFVDSASAQLKTMQESQRKLRARATEPKCWVHVYHSARYEYGNSRKSGYQWEQKEVFHVERGEGEHKYYRFCYKGENIHGQPADVELHHVDYGAGLLDACTANNQVYADWYEHNVKSLENYIRRQQRRIDDWKPRPLFPVEQKDDKAGFEPEKAPY
jgi:hypothetical protein